MSLTVFQGNNAAGAFLVACCAAHCDRCAKRGRCVQFNSVNDEGECIGYTLCLTCWEELALAIASEVPLADLELPF